MGHPPEPAAWRTLRCRYCGRPVLETLEPAGWVRVLCRRRDCRRWQVRNLAEAASPAQAAAC